MKMHYLLFLSGSIVAATPATAQVYGDLPSWQADVGAFSRDTLYGTEFDNISSLNLGDGTALSFSSPVSIREVGSGWATWSGGYAGQVLFADGLTSLTAVFTSGPVFAFGFFAQPDSFGVFDITMSLSDGSFLTQSVEGNSGADFFGWSGPSINSFVISSSADFALGDFYSANVATPAVPEPGTWAMMLLGFGFVGGAMRSAKRRQKVTVSYA